jgi:hypothetical protein
MDWLKGRFGPPLVLPVINNINLKFIITEFAMSKVFGNKFIRISSFTDTFCCWHRIKSRAVPFDLSFMEVAP